jgi:hypothetical protein
MNLLSLVSRTLLSRRGVVLRSSGIGNASRRSNPSIETNGNGEQELARRPVTILQYTKLCAMSCTWPGFFFTLEALTKLAYIIRARVCSRDRVPTIQ